jgi:O-antigen/teichoic acid export membrane protein
MVTILLSAFVLFVITFFLRNRYAPEIIVSLWLICLLVVIQAFVDVFLENLLRTDNRFDILSKSEIFKSFFGFFLMIVMIWLWHLYGLIASVILSTLSKGIYIYDKTAYRFSLVWDFSELRRLLIIGFPIIIGLILLALYNSVDRLVIVRYLDSRQLGYYALGLTISKFLLIAQTGAYGILEPKIFQRYGEKGEVQALRKIVLDPMIILTLFFPLVMGLAYIGSPYLIYLFLPKYLPSLSCVHIMILGSFFFIFMEGCYTFIVAINRQMLIVWTIGLLTLVSFGLNYLLIRRGWGIEGVALGITVINAVTACSFLCFTLNHFFKGKEKIRFFSRLFIPFIIIGILLILMDHIWPVTGFLKKEWRTLILKGVLLFILSFPLLLLGKKWLVLLGTSDETKAEG